MASRSAIILVLTLLPISFWAADPLTVDHPIMGYVSQSSPPELRAIVGVPGAAVFSKPLQLPKGLRRIHLPPGQNYAILERTEQQPAVLFLSGSASGVAAPIEGAVSAFEFVVFSPLGRSAVLGAAESGRLQVITGLPGAPRVVRDVDMTGFPGWPLRAAVSDDGNGVLLSSATAVYELIGQSARAVITVASASLTFLPDSTDAAVGDSTGGLYLVRNVPNSSQVSLIAANLGAPGSLVAGLDGRTLYAADMVGHRVLLVDAADGNVHEYEVQVVPVSLLRLRSADTFLLAYGPGRPGWVFFKDGDSYRSAFVPAANGVTRRRPPDREAKHP